MGAHAGEALVVDDNYVGATVYVAARIAAVAHGGQVVPAMRAGRWIPSTCGSTSAGTA